MSRTGGKHLARMRGITKRFGPVTVLQDVAFDIHAGEVHVLAGENGAGKSTLIKILAGVHTEFEGAIEFLGAPVRPKSPLEANTLGVAVIHQEFSMVRSMPVADNIFLGRAPTRFGFVDRSRQRVEAKRLLEQLGLELDVDRLVEEFPIAIQQLIEIAKALGHNAKVIVMDEPTSALSAPEVERLFALIHKLKSNGCGIVYITHKMEEIERIADRITVLRDGCTVGSAPASELPVPKLIEWMVGRELDRQFPRHTPHLGEESLSLDRFSVFPDGDGSKAVADRVSLTVREGEILGIGGLQGSGASELLMGLFGGYGRNVQGDVRLNGRSIRIASPREAIRAGIAMLTNDRKVTGLVLSSSIIANAILADLKNLTPGGWRRPANERRVAKTITDPLHLRAASLGMEVGALSGGNQQKVAIAKWLQTKPRLLLLDEPTRGIDVGAKREVYELMNEWTAQGIAIILITSEMPELLAMSDRLVVMHRGCITAEITQDEATASRVLEAAMGHTRKSETQ